MWFYGIGIGIVVGLAAGAIAERLPIPALLQSLGAAYVAVVLGAVGVAFVWFMRPPESGGLGAVSVGFAAVELIVLAGFGVVIAGLHFLLARFRASKPAIVKHRAVILGCVGGLCGALPVAWMLAVTDDVVSRL